MSFEVAPDAYGQFMGRYSEPLAGQFVELLKLEPGQRALDVGSGPGALTSELVDRLGSAAVSAVDPSEQFISALRAEFPHVDARLAGAESLPFDDGIFDAVAAQLVVHFMSDPVAGIAEMGRVARPDGVVAASVWDFGGGRAPLSTFWKGVAELDPNAPNESERAGARAGHLAELFGAAGLREIVAGELTVSVEFESFAQWWNTFTLGVGPAGAHYASLDDNSRGELEAVCAGLLPAGPFTIDATAWTAVGRA
jgi:SAM-dependent methyltransferase